MRKPRSKTFPLSEPHHLFKVDRWWAAQLRSGAKEILSVEWQPLGQMKWTLKLTYRPVGGSPALNVGHPDYADYSLEDLNMLLYDALSNFDSAYHDFTLLESKVTAWGLKEGADGEMASLEDNGLDEVDRLIALYYVWPEYKSLKKVCAFLAVQMREAEAEVKARESSDYFAVKVDRGMLRDSFEEQIGYDNEFLFEEIEFIAPEDSD